MADRAVCVIGCGLIGGSVLRAAAAAGRPVWGVDIDPDTAAAAVTDGFTVGTDLDPALRRAADQDALMVLAVPLPALPPVARRIAALAPTSRLTDVISVKTAVADVLARLAPAARYVGGHPMAGSAESGWAVGDAALFRGAVWAVGSEDGGDAPVWADVAELAWACGARVVPVAADEHDLAVARVSHLPHLMAAVLAAVGAGDPAAPDRPGDDLALALSAGSFADGTRVAGTRPELVLAMCEGNRDALLGAVDDALGRLGAMRGALASTGGLAATVRAGHAGRLRWAAARTVAAEALPRGLSPAALRERGRRGTSFTGWVDAAGVDATGVDAAGVDAAGADAAG